MGMRFVAFRSWLKLFTDLVLYGICAMADEEDLDLRELDDQELVEQMWDDLYDGLADEVVEGTNILLERGWPPYRVLTEALVEGMRIVGVDFREVPRTLRQQIGRVGGAVGQLRADGVGPGTTDLGECLVDAGDDAGDSPVDAEPSDDRGDVPDQRRAGDDEQDDRDREPRDRRRALGVEPAQLELFHQDERRCEREHSDDPSAG